MSIEELTLISYVLFGMAVCFLAAAAVMFFKFDILRIYRILKSAAGTQAPVAQMAGEKAGGNMQEQMAVRGTTQKYEQTTALDTIKFILVQDITYTHDEEE